jgi:phage-related protein
MATGNLVTRATLDSKEFDSALDRMKGNIKSFSKSGTEASNELGSAFSDILGEFAPSIGKDIQSVIDKVQTAANIIKKAFNFSDLKLGANITQQMQSVTNVTNNASSNIAGALTTSGLAGIEAFKKLGGNARRIFDEIVKFSSSTKDAMLNNIVYIYEYLG